MFDTPLQRLRKSYALADLPTTITTGAPGATMSKPIEAATVDDVAFAVQALNDEMDALYRRTTALRSLHDKARRAGALGSALAVDTAVQTLEGAQ
jgi:hypothetical protein